MRAISGQGETKRDIDEELRFHIEERTAQNIAAGMPPEDAARQARKQFGNWQTVREECREVRKVNWGEGALRDLRFSLRMLGKSLGFTTVAVLMLALGIGSVVAMFSVTRAMVLHPFASPNFDRLVHVWANDGQAITLADFFEIKEQTRSFEEFAAYGPQQINIGGERPESVPGVGCMPGVLRAFGVKPALGRWLEAADDLKSAPPVAVISHELWQRRFNADPAMIGRTIRLDGSTVTVVGVMPKLYEFSCPWLQQCDIWRPLQHERNDQGNIWTLCLAVGCLKKDVSLTGANAEVKAIGARLKAAHPQAYAHKPLLVKPVAYEIQKYANRPVAILCISAAIILIVACANIASMLLARGARRHAEFGVRLALGASRAQIFRLPLCEGLLLGLGGTILGAFIGALELRYLAEVGGMTEARRAAMIFDMRALLFSAGLSVVAGLFAGVPPALAALRISVADLLRTDSRSASGSSARHHLLRGLVITQVAVAFVLANAAVLLLTSYGKMLSANAALATDYVTSADLNLSDPRYFDGEFKGRFCQQLSEQVSALPGVAAAGVTTDVPLEWGVTSSILANGEVFDPLVQRTPVIVTAITGGYFSAAAIPLLRGRTIEKRDSDKYNFGVVVNRAFAEAYWPGQDPVGKIIRPNDLTPWYHAQVVGVVENVRQQGIKSEPLPQMFWSMERAWGTSVHLVVRSTRQGAGLAFALRETASRLDPDSPISRTRTFKAVVREASKSYQVFSGLVTACMVVAIGLVGAGLYGTLSYHVSQRTREIGVRVALGAGGGDVLRLVLRQGFSWVAIGLAFGIGGSLAVAAGLKAILYDVNPIDPKALAAAVVVIVLAAALACWPPARRAARIDPMTALRCE